MKSSFHIYHLLFTSSPAPQIRLPKTLISGYGFPCPFLLDYSNVLTFRALSNSLVHSFLSSALKSSRLLQKTGSSTHLITISPRFITEDTVFQVFVEGEKFIAGWKYGEGYLNSDYPIDTLSQFDELKSILAETLSSKYRLRLTYLQAEFILGNDSNAYFIAVSHYSYTQLRDRVVSMQLPALVSNSTPHSFIRTQTSRFHSFKSENIAHEVGVEVKLSKFMKNQESTKYIRYSQLKTALSQNLELLSNEVLYGKQLAKLSDQLLVKSTKNVKELRKLSGLLKTRLMQDYPDWVDEEEQEIKNKRIENYRIIVKKSKKKKKDLEKETCEIVNKILMTASTNLDSLKKKVNF
jgi:hypothetical protein